MNAAHSSPPLRRLCLIGLDGVPHGLLQRMLAEGVMPHLAALLQRGTLYPMTSVHPWVSCVAWTTLMTGCNPGRHGIFGFVDREPATLKTYLVTARHLRTEALWDILSRAGKRVISINVPGTYPPKPVNGIQIADFLCPNVEKVVYPPTLLPKLKELGYRIDIDPWLARASRDRFLDDLRDVLDRRMVTMLYLLDHETWDVFIGVLMETDRLHHFLFEAMEEGHPTYAPAFFDLYRRIDAFIGQVAARLDEHTPLVILSDHGFCRIRKEVYVNRWLYEAGYLKFSRMPPQDLGDLAPGTLAYGLDPGRIFVNLRGRERDGRVAPGAAYERLRDQLIAEAEALRDPDTGEKVVLKAYRREELYDGPHLAAAADIILAPVNGYDPKGALWKETLTHKDPAMVGMHTYDNAILCAVGLPLVAPALPLRLTDVMPTLLGWLGVPVPPAVDGQSLLDSSPLFSFNRGQE